MNLHHHADLAAELRSLPLDTDRITEFQAMIPVSATPATIVAVGQGVAAGAAVIGAVGVGAAVGQAAD